MKKQALGYVLAALIVSLSFSAYAAMFKISSYLAARAANPTCIEALSSNRPAPGGELGKMKSAFSRYGNVTKVSRDRVETQREGNSGTPDAQTSRVKNKNGKVVIKYEESIFSRLGVGGQCWVHDGRICSRGPESKAGVYRSASLGGSRQRACSESPNRWLQAGVYRSA